MTSQTTITTTSSSLSSSSSSSFTAFYFARLGLDPTKLDVLPTFAKLAAIQEAHLARIPFENLSQHGVVNDDMSLDISTLTHKVLIQRRGGLCFELNGLLSVFLQELGYHVVRVPAFVVVVSNSIPQEQPNDDDNNNNDLPTHMTLIVTVTEDGFAGGSDESSQRQREQQQNYLVDVGFREPPLHPLPYDVESLNGTTEYVTPEGMHSKLQLDPVTQQVTLYWNKKGTASWTPRLRWNYAASILPNNRNNTNNQHQNSNDASSSLLSPLLLPPPLSSSSSSSIEPLFVHALRHAQAPDSPLSHNLLVCTITREHKYMLVGTCFRISGPPRFATTGAVPIVSTEYVETAEAARQLLERYFGIPYESTQGLSLATSNASLAARRKRQQQPQQQR